MKKTFKLMGLDCTNCAAKIENAVQGLDGVIFASINFITGNMIIEADDAKFAEIVKSATYIAKKVEPDIVIKKG